MNKVFFILALLVSCAGVPDKSPYLLNLKGTKFKQCGDNIFIIDRTVPRKHKDSTVKAFQYWNKALGQYRFADVGFINPNPNKIYSYTKVSVEHFTPPLGRNSCIRTSMIFKDSGCMSHAKISIRPECVTNLNTKEMETLVRQSIANTLGLENTMKLGNLMHYGLDYDAQHPIDASKESVEAIKLLYGLNDG